MGKKTGEKREKETLKTRRKRRDTKMNKVKGGLVRERERRKGVAAEKI